VDRGYPSASAIAFVCNHYRLEEEQRIVLARIVVPADLALQRMAKSLMLENLRGRAVFVDGYNALITAESLLAGCSAYLCDDGFIRDTRGYFRRYKSSTIAKNALIEILDILADSNASRVDILLDEQISHSGELACTIRLMMQERHLAGEVRCVRDADHQLKICGEVVASSDGNVIDAALNAIDLPAEIARRHKISTQII
jgi:hypothetical protein